MARAAAQQALSWAESDDMGVVVENMFQPSDFEVKRESWSWRVCMFMFTWYVCMRVWSMITPSNWGDVRLADFWGEKKRGGGVFGDIVVSIITFTRPHVPPNLALILARTHGAVARALGSLIKLVPRILLHSQTGPFTLTRERTKSRLLGSHAQKLSEICDRYIKYVDYS